MKITLSRFAAALVLGVLCAASAASAQDFQRSYRIGAGGSISIKNVSGNILISGYDGDSVNVQGIKEGRDKDQVEVEDTSSGNNVALRALYPQCRNCSTDASVRFVVQVPRSVAYKIGKIGTASGNIEITNLTGDVHAGTASGDVLIRDVRGAVNASTASGTMRVKEVVGTVSASSASGDVEAEITQLEGNDDMRFSTASGNVSVKIPSNLDAEVRMSTVSGTVKTDFPLEVRKERNSGHSSARGRLGSGSRQLHISSASGDVSLTNM